EVRQYLKVTGTLSDNSTVEIAGYDMKGDWGSTPSPATDKAGAHEVTVSYKGYEDNITVNYKPINIEEIWVEAATSDGITKNYLGLDEFDRDSIIVNVRFSDGTVQENVTDYVVIYDGGHSELWAGDEKVTISYHDVTCEIDELSVTKREYDLSGFDFGNLTYDYDGDVKNYELNGEFEAGTVSYTYAKLENGEWQTVSAASVKNAGTYMVSVKFELSEGKYAANYEEINSVEVQILIKKVNYEKVEEIKFELTVADYDYGNSLADKMHVSGIPEGVTPVYEFKYQDGTILTADEVVNAGKYTVTVSFVGDENHYGIAPVSTQFTVNKITPAVDPSVSGNLVKGTLLKQLTFMDNLDGVKGKYEWVNGEQELQAGVNRCYYVFNPDDAINYESVRGYIDLSVGLAPVGGSDSGIGGISEWWWIALVGITALSIILAICSIVVAGKKKPAGDDDGFYDDVTEADLM
ncbi:MAG: bacterial Ig-like domain-containing protein, partial [Clostridia bacterium]|nr:bacterial Ig-like domain-containing protein [Clostridia bacterium]